MIWVIEFRSGNYLRYVQHCSGPRSNAMRLNSKAEADEFIRANEWVAMNGGMAKLLDVEPNGSADFPAPVDLVFYPEKEIPIADAVAVVHKMREDDRFAPIIDFVQSLSEKQGAVAMRVWRSILQINPHIALPTCGIDDEDEGSAEFGHAYFGWNPGGRTLDVSISPLGDVSWFFADHHTGMSTTSDECPGDGFLGFVGLFTRKEPVPR